MVSLFPIFGSSAAGTKPVTVTQDLTTSGKYPSVRTSHGHIPTEPTLRIGHEKPPAGGAKTLKTIPPGMLQGYLPRWFWTDSNIESMTPDKALELARDHVPSQLTLNFTPTVHQFIQAIAHNEPVEKIDSLIQQLKTHVRLGDLPVLEDIVGQEHMQVTRQELQDTLINPQDERLGMRWYHRQIIGSGEIVEIALQKVLDPKGETEAAQHVLKQILGDLQEEILAVQKGIEQLTHKFTGLGRKDTRPTTQSHRPEKPQTTEELQNRLKLLKERLIGRILLENQIKNHFIEVEFRKAAQ